MAGLFSHRLHFLMGKGGAGKTSVVTALALATSRQDKKTLLIELGHATPPARSLGLSAAGDTPQTDPLCANPERTGRARRIPAAYSPCSASAAAPSLRASCSALLWPPPRASKNS